MASLDLRNMGEADAIDILFQWARVYPFRVRSWVPCYTSGTSCTYYSIFCAFIHAYNVQTCPSMQHICHACLPRCVQDAATRHGRFSA